MEETLSGNMKKKLSTKPGNSKKLTIGYVITTLLQIIGGSTYDAGNDEIDEEVEKIVKSETEDYIKNMERRMSQPDKQSKVKGTKSKKNPVRQTGTEENADRQTGVEENAIKRKTIESDREREQI